MSSDEPLFLEVDDVLEIHATQLEVHRGGAGLRDRGLLESAVLAAADVLRRRAIPNFFFHLATAYGILRHEGVPLQKIDFMGA